MTHHQYSGYPTQPGTQSNRSNKKTVPWFVAVLIAVGCFGFGCAAGAISAGGSDSGNGGRDTLAVSPQSEAKADAPEEQSEPEEPVGEYTPKPEDFKVTLNVVEKSCFGSAGCNVTYKVDVKYTGEPLSDDQSYTVSYEVKGGTEPKIGSFDTQGMKADISGREFISTSGPNAKLTAKVTSVL